MTRDDDMCPNCVTPWKCNGPHIVGLTDDDAVTDCATCAANSRLTRDTHVLLVRAHEEHDAARRAQEDHEASAHRIQPPRRWEPAPAVAVTWSSPEGVSYTFAPAPEDHR